MTSPRSPGTAPLPGWAFARRAGAAGPSWWTASATTRCCWACSARSGSSPPDAIAARAVGCADAAVTGCGAQRCAAGAALTPHAAGNAPPNGAERVRGLRGCGTVGAGRSVASPRSGGPAVSCFLPVWHGAPDTPVGPDTCDGRHLGDGCFTGSLTLIGVHGREVVAFGAAATNACAFHSSGTIPFWRGADGDAHWKAGEVIGMPPVHMCAESCTRRVTGSRWGTVPGPAPSTIPSRWFSPVKMAPTGAGWTRRPWVVARSRLRPSTSKGRPVPIG